MIVDLETCDFKTCALENLRKSDRAVYGTMEFDHSCQATDQIYFVRKLHNVISKMRCSAVLLEKDGVQSFPPHVGLRIAGACQGK